MRLCKFISKEKLKSTKCDEEFNRLLSSKYNPAEIDALSDQPPNMHEITFDENHLIEAIKITDIEISVLIELYINMMF